MYRLCKVYTYSSFKVSKFSREISVQVHFPNNPLQPGPLYFLTPRKCAIFGICCKAIPRQVNFLIEEAFDTGKGANTVISMLHFYLEHHGLNSNHIHLHADNCVGQNKNIAVIQVKYKYNRQWPCDLLIILKWLPLQYLMWRVLTELS